MAKCGACGRFLSSAAADGANCCKCKLIYHRECVGLSEGNKISVKWSCPACKVKVPKGDNSLTPVKPLNYEDTPVTSCSPLDGLSETETDIKYLCREMRGLREDVSTIKGEFANFKKCMDILQSRVDSLEERISQLENDNSKSSCNTTLETALEDLRSQLRERDQRLLLNDLEISGVPETKGENCVHLITLLSKKLGVEVESRDIINVDRVGSILRNRTDTGDGSSKPRNLVIQLARRSLHDELLKAARVRRGATTEGLQIPGPTRRFYVNERLTQYNRQLFAKAREAARSKAWKFVWTRAGRIYARKDNGLTVHKILGENDIQKVII